MLQRGAVTLWISLLRYIALQKKMTGNSFSAPQQVTQCCHCVTIVYGKYKRWSIATINTEKCFTPSSLGRIFPQVVKVTLLPSMVLWSKYA